MRKYHTTVGLFSPNLRQLCTRGMHGWGGIADGSADPPSRFTDVRSSPIGLRLFPASSATRRFGPDACLNPTLKRLPLIEDRKHSGL